VSQVAPGRAEPAAQAGVVRPHGTVTGPVHGDPLVWATVPVRSAARAWT
jgi:hypothetical protein